MLLNNSGVELSRFTEKGEDNHVEIGEGCKSSQTTIEVRGNGNRILIGKDCEFRGLVFLRGNNCLVEIGAGTTAAGLRISCGDRTSIRIGRDCMFSRNVELRSWDEHPIYDLDTREQINKASNVTIGDHVWVGEGASISKGARIPSGCVIASKSMVSGQLQEEDAIYAGVPAVLKRRRILWARSPRDVPWHPSKRT